MTVDQVTRKLKEISLRGHGRKQLILTDWNSTSEITSIQMIQDGKLRVIVEFEYGDLNE
jgi:hypothetical protein